MMKLEQCFVANLHRDQNVPMHDHPSLELVYFLNGRGRTTVNGTSSEIRNSFFTIIPAGVWHDQTNLTDVSSLCLKVSGSGLETFEGGWMDAGGELESALRRFLREATQRQPFYEEIGRGLLDEIVGLTKRTILENSRTTTKEELVGRAMAIIREREGRVTVSALAERLCISDDYLRHLFQEYHQIPPIRQIITSRIEKAKELLGGSSLSVTEVADRCGFESVYYFSRFFKKETSMSPARYRAEKCK